MSNKVKRSKIILPNGCWSSKPSVSPKNYKDKNASTAKDWCIQYRFYDPTFIDKKGKVIAHQVIFKGMNDTASITERRDTCEDLITNEILNLKRGYNPRTKTFNIEKTLLCLSFLQIINNDILVPIY